MNDLIVTTSDAINVPEGHIGIQGENRHIEWRELKIRKPSGK